MKDTPRTDAEFKLEAFFDGVGIVETVLVEFARQLETELADKEKQLAEARAEIENLQWHINNEKAKAEAALELNDKALALAAEARADAEHWKSECNALQRMVHEARAEIKLKNEELDMFWAEQQAMGEIIECKNKLIEQMLEVLEAARLFIENGIEMGYISEPQPGTPESATLPAIKAAIKAAKEEIQ